MNTTDVSVRFDSAVIREALARSVALDLAGGDRGRLRPQPNGSVLVVNHRDFDTRSWDRPKRKKVRKS